MIFNKDEITELIECFVSVYGEKHRKIITDKINNCLILLCGYKNQKEIEKNKININAKYIELLRERISTIIDLSNTDMTFLFGDTIFKNDDLIGAFSSTAQKIVESDKKTSAVRLNTKSILAVRDEFSKISSKNISPAMADDLIKIYDEIVKQANSELFFSTINFDENKTKLSKYDFLETPVFSLESYDFEEQQHNGVQPNFIKDKDGNIMLFPIINFSIVKNKLSQIFGSPDYFDVLLIHEINHVIGMHLLKYIDKGNYEIQMGLIVSNAGNNTTKYYYMEYIDEVFNQYIAKKVTNLLHSKGIYLLDNPKNSQVNDSSLYEMSEFLLEDFFSMFYDELCDIYASGCNLKKFYSNIDTNELKALGSLIKEYLQKLNIQDISEQENIKYAQKVKEITTRIEQSSYKEKIYELVQLLDLNDLENLTPEIIKSSFDSIMKKLNIVNSDSEISKKMKEVLLVSLNYALNNIELIKKTKGINTNDTSAKMYKMQRVELLESLNKKNPLILNTIIIELEKTGLDISKIIKFLNSLEYGLIYPETARKIIEIFGDNFYKSLIELQETEQTNFNKLALILEQLENDVLSDIQNLRKNSL